MRRLLHEGGYVTAATPGYDLGPLLRHVRACGGGHVLAHIMQPLTAKPIQVLSDAALRKSLQDMCATLGITKQVGLHSCRIGGATAAAQNKVPDRLVMQHGRWKSDAVARGYMRASLETRLEVTKGLDL